MMAEMTSLELAQAIADAVVEADDDDSWSDGYRDSRAASVLKVLRDTGHWFCRVDHDAKGVTIDVPLPFEDQP